MYVLYAEVCTHVVLFRSVSNAKKTNLASGDNAMRMITPTLWVCCTRYTDYVCIPSIHNPHF